MTIVGDVEVDVLFLTQQAEKQLAGKLNQVASGAKAKVPNIDTKAAEAGIDKFGRFVEGKFKGIAGSSNPLLSNIKQLDQAGVSLGATFGEAAGPIGIAVAATAAVGAVALATAKAFADQSAEVRKFSITTGLATEEASRFVATATLLGVSTEKLRNGFFFLSRNIESNNQQLQAHSDLIVRNAAGSVDLTATFYKTADAIHATSDAQQRNAIAAALFGRQARDLVPILAKGSDALKAMGTDADRMGLVLTDKAVASAKAFDIGLRTLTQSLRGVEIQVGQQTAPALGAMAFGLSHLVQNVTAATKAAPQMGTALKLAATAAAPFYALLAKLGEKDFKNAAAKGAAADAVEADVQASNARAQGLLTLVDAEDTATKANVSYYQAALKVNDIQRQINEIQAGGGEAAKKLAAAQDELRSAYERLEDAQHKVDDSALSITEKQQAATLAALQYGNGSIEAAKASQDLTDALFDQKRANEDLQDAKKDVGDKSAAEKDIRDNEKTRELADLNTQLATAQGNVAESAKAVVKANAGVTEAQDAANGVTDEAKDKVDILRQAYETFAGTLDPNSPLRKNLQGYIDELSTANTLGTAVAITGSSLPGVPGSALGGPGTVAGGDLGGTGTVGGGDLGGGAVGSGGLQGGVYAPITVTTAPQQSPEQIGAAIGFDLLRRATPVPSPR